MPVTRFAPSPTGLLHLGHAVSALFARRAAGTDGTFLLRIEDIDPVRCRPEFTDAIFEDLRWLGLDWREPVRIQSRHMDVYTQARGRLREAGLLYPCFCTRREVERDALAAGYAPHAGDAAFIYPGTCRALSAKEREAKLAEGPANWRLDTEAALKRTGPLFWRDAARGKIEATPQQFGDVVLARKDVAASYHLCVTVDDHLQGVTLVTRGDDLFEATHIHRLLQALLGYETPAYHHHALLKGADGRRFAKRDGAVTLRALRGQGMTPGDVAAEIERLRPLT